MWNYIIHKKVNTVFADNPVSIGAKAPAHTIVTRAALNAEKPSAT